MRAHPTSFAPRLTIVSIAKVAAIAAIVCWGLAVSAAARKDAAGKPEPVCGAEDLLAGKRPVSSQETQGELGLLTDGAVGPEGTTWNAPVAVTLATTAGSVTYDLGQPRSISALVLQADANDTYKVLGSVDPRGSPASFRLLTLIPSVLERGHGLRTRAVEISPTTARYLRVGEGNGDGFYSISELAAYCQKPTPFPPTLRLVEPPPAPVTDASPAASPSNRSNNDGSVLVLCVAAGALAWLAYRSVKR